jgi:hypothetical protein
MAVFCGGCGKALDGERFCRFCGVDSNATIPEQAVPAGISRSATPVTPTPPVGVVAVPAKTSNTLLTVIVICVVVFGGFAGVLVYAAYWAKNKVASTARDYGVELPSDSHTRAHKSAASQRDPCSFLTPAEVAAATGVGITEAHTEEHTCNFASADGTGAGAFVEFEWGSGKILMTATRAGGKLMTMAPGTELQSVPGIGDEAYFQNGMLTVRHGDDGFRIMMPAELLSKNLGRRTVLDNIAEMREMEKELAQKVLSRM